MKTRVKRKVVLKSSKNSVVSAIRRIRLGRGPGGSRGGLLGSKVGVLTRRTYGRRIYRSFSPLINPVHEMPPFLAEVLWPRKGFFLVLARGNLKSERTWLVVLPSVFDHFKQKCQKVPRLPFKIDSCTFKKTKINTQNRTPHSPKSEIPMIHVVCGGFTPCFTRQICAVLGRVKVKKLDAF